MRRAISIACIMLLLCALTPVGLGEGMATMVVVNCMQAPMYSAPDGKTVLTYVQVRETVNCINSTEGYCYVIYGNFVGYIEQTYLVNANVLTGTDTRTAPSGVFRGIPEFPFEPQDCVMSQWLATRSGPGTKYTNVITFTYDNLAGTDVQVLYSVYADNVEWVCLQLWFAGYDYMLYTGRKRIKTDNAIPVIRETSKTCTITQRIKPYYGPGEDYMTAEYTVPAGANVSGLYHKDGWLMFDYLVGVEYQRGWVPQDAWKEYVAPTAKPATPVVVRVTPTPRAYPSIFDAMIGDVILYGKYLQTDIPSYADDPIEWLVIDKTDTAILVLSVYALEGRDYHSKNENVTWETCDIRAWMNDTFCLNAFNDSELERVMWVELENPKTGSVRGGNNTIDRVFLLSVPEVRKYFPRDPSRSCEPTDFAISQGIYVNPATGNIWWWTRSPGSKPNKAAGVYGGGKLDLDGCTVDNPKYKYPINGFRPAMWINIER